MDKQEEPMSSESAAAFEPKSFSSAELKKVGVTILNKERPDLKCDRCGERWSPARSGGNLPRGYWLCPRGCNDNEQEEGGGE